MDWQCLQNCKLTLKWKKDVFKDTFNENLVKNYGEDSDLGFILELNILKALIIFAMIFSRKIEG